MPSSSLRCCGRRAGSSPCSSCSRAALRLPLATGLGAIGVEALCGGLRRRRARRVGAGERRADLNDTHIDLTREKVYTPSATAMAVVDELRTPVRITYFYRSEDPIGQRARNILEVMGRRNPLLTVAHRRSRQAAGTGAPRGRPPLQRRHRRGRRPARAHPGHRRGGDRHRHPARAAHAFAHRLLPRGPWRVLDGRLRVPYAPRGRLRPQPRRRVLADHRDRRATASAGCAGSWRRRATRPASWCWRRPARSPAIARWSSPPTRAPRSCRRRARRCGPISQGGGSALLLLDLGFVPEPGLAAAAFGPRRPARAAGGRRSVEPLPARCRDGGGDRLRSAPDHPHPVADLLPRHPAADA